MKKGQLRAMENKNSERPSLGITIQEDKTKVRIGAEEDTSSVIKKERDGNDKQNNLKPEPSSPNEKDLAIIKQDPLANNTNNSTTDNPSITETNTDSSPSVLKTDLEEELIKSVKAEMGEVREENERLKMLLSRLLKDYRSLQAHFFDILRQQDANNTNNNDAKPLNNKDSISTTSAHDDDDHDNHVHQENDEDQLVSLSLGRASSTSTTHQDEELRKNEKKSSTSSKDDEDQGFNGNGELALGLGTGSSSEIMKDEEATTASEPTEMWPQSKVLKTARSEGEENDGVSQISPLKKARVSVRARCETPTMNDGCQWRKYGQKIAKGNPCPRAYYRCTVSPSCPVRKQVQRCIDDMSILITTYEGTHNHPLPVSATAMASTTSAAASMLQSRSTTSSSNNQLLPGGLSSNFFAGPSTTSTTLFQSSNIRQPLAQQFYFPNNTSISTTTSHPTVTLDLTVLNPSSSSHLGPRYSSTCLSFSSSSSSSVLPWNITTSYNNNNGYFTNYGIMSQQNKSNPIVGSHGLDINNDRSHSKSQFQEANNSLYQSYMKNIISQSSTSGTTTATTHNHQQSLTETIAAATKAITSNPKFQSALAAALTSFVDKGENGL